MGVSNKWGGGPQVHIHLRRLIKLQYGHKLLHDMTIYEY